MTSLWSQMSLDEFAKTDTALQIESEEFGTFWLVSNSDARRLLPSPHCLHYTAAEAKRVVEMAHQDEELNGIRVLHGLKKEFGGRMVQPPKKR